MTLLEIVRNPHFANLAAVMRVPIIMYTWRWQHPKVPVWILWGNVEKTANAEMFATNRDAVTTALLAFLAAITHEDPRLSYATEDLDWLLEMLSGPDALVAVMMLLAYATAPDTMVSAREVADATGTAESGWRNKAAAGTIPGAIKKKSGWLLPASVLRAQGITLPDNVGSVAAEIDEEEATPLAN